MLTEIKKSIDIDEKDFKTLVQNQKISSRKIEDLLEFSDGYTMDDVELSIAMDYTAAEVVIVKV